MTATTSFGPLTFTHPSAWRASYATPQDLPPPDSDGYLTNEHARLPLSRLAAGGVYVDVAAIYQPESTLPQIDAHVGPYPADLDTGPDAMSECPPGTTVARAVTAAPASPSIEPSEIWIFGCFARPIAAGTLSAFTAMTFGARIRTRAAATVPVPGARPCRSGDLSVRYGPSSLAQPPEQSSAMAFVIQNVSPRTCTLRGYPTVALSAGGRTLPFRDVHATDFRTRTLYLRPQLTAWFKVIRTRCDLGRATAATTTIIVLPGTERAIRLPAHPAGDDRDRIDYCDGEGGLLQVGPLVAY